MALILALIECALICATACAAITFGSGAGESAAHLGSALVRSLAVSFSCVAAFHCQQLYDLRVVGSFRVFLSRLPRSIGLAFILTLALWRLIPSAGISR